MRKLTIMMLSIAVLAVAGHAFADPGVEIGEGANPTRTSEPSPADPTSGYTNDAPEGTPVFLAVDGDASSDGRGAAVAVGEEDTSGSVGRVAVHQSPDAVTVYMEDYTETPDGDRDVVADAIERVNDDSGLCPLGCGPDDNPNDALSVHT